MKKKPKLVLLQIKGQLEFARCHCHWTDDDWDHVVFFDETKINQFCLMVAVGVGFVMAKVKVLEWCNKP